MVYSSIDIFHLLGIDNSNDNNVGIGFTITIIKSWDTITDWWFGTCFPFSWAFHHPN